MVERQQPLVEKSVDELDHEERVARGLLVHQLRQRGGARPLAAKRIRNELTHVLMGEGASLTSCTSVPAFRIVSSFNINGWAGADIAGALSRTICNGSTAADARPARGRFTRSDLRT